MLERTKKEDGMFKRVMIGLFIMSVVAIWWTEAMAACPPGTFRRIPQPNGTKICVSYSPGSIQLIFETEVIEPPDASRPIITDG
jgi:hypothetical protein